MWLKSVTSQRAGYLCNMHIAVVYYVKPMLTPKIKTLEQHAQEILFPFNQDKVAY